MELFLLVYLHRAGQYINTDFTGLAGVARNLFLTLFRFAFNNSIAITLLALEKPKPMIFLFLLLLAVVIAGIASWFVARKAYRSLQANNNNWSAAIAILVFLGCFAVLVFTTGWLILSNIRFER